jgi:hypothetical protein
LLLVASPRADRREVNGKRDDFVSIDGSPWQIAAKRKPPPTSAAAQMPRRSANHFAGMVDQGILTKQREKLAKFAFVAAVWGCYADREHHYVNAKESPYQRMR